MTYSVKKMTGMRALFVALLSSGLISCASSSPIFSNSNSVNDIPVSQTFDPGSYDTFQSAKFTTTFDEETFKRGDVAKISVNGLKEFSGIYTVGRDGKIYFGHIGDIYVEGHTVPEVQLKVREGYNKCCLLNPNVSVEREDNQPVFGKIVVDGAVSDAGVFEIQDVIKLSEAVALAGGMTDVANPEMTVLSRIIDGERKISNVNMTDIQLYGAADPLIFPNDVVFIQDSKGRLLYQDFIKTLPLVSAVIFAATR